MSDWIDKSLQDQQAALERSIAAARKGPLRAPQIKNGDEVVCAECLEPIPKRRVELYPHVTHCVECLNQLEE